jgi:hypothetical protein
VLSEVSLLICLFVCFLLLCGFSLLALLSFSLLLDLSLCFLSRSISDEVREIIKKNSDILLALLYRLSRCLMDNQHLPSSALIPEKQSSSASSSSSLQHLKMIDFPYSYENFTLFQTICRLLYQFDVFSMIESADSNGNGNGGGNAEESTVNKGNKGIRPSLVSTSLAHATVPVDHDFVDYFLTENIQNPNFTKKIAEIENVDDIHLHLMKARSHPSSLRSGATNNSPTPSGHPPSFHVTLASNSDHHTPRAVAGNVSPVYYISPKELLNFIIMIVLTTGPYDWSLYITANHDLTSVFYTGNLIHCEECILQLLMLSSEKNITYLFSLLPSASASISASASSSSSLAPASPATVLPSSYSSSSHNNHNKSDNDIPLNRLSISTSGASRVSLCQDMIDIIISHRRLFFANSLIRILTTIIQRIKNGSFDLNEKAAMICPILVRSFLLGSIFFPPFVLCFPFLTHLVCSLLFSSHLFRLFL